MNINYSFLFLFGILVVTVIALGYLFMSGFSQNSYPATSYISSQTTSSPQTPDLDITYATTSQERYTGLSNKKKLPPKEGLMLVYNSPEKHGIVMRKMSFPIDIVWINSNGTVVDIKHDAKPSSYQSSTEKVVFTPQENARFVLEVPTGTAKSYNWNIGDSLSKYVPNTE